MYKRWRNESMASSNGPLRLCTIVRTWLLSASMMNTCWASKQLTATSEWPATSPSARREGPTAIVTMRRAGALVGGRLPSKLPATSTHSKEAGSRLTTNACPAWVGLIATPRVSRDEATPSMLSAPASYANAASGSVLGAMPMRDNTLTSASSDPRANTLT